MDWYRVYHGLPYDARLGVVARRAGLARAQVVALFLLLLDFASQAFPRGTLKGFDAEEAAIALEIPVADIDAALAAMREKGLLDGKGGINDWQQQPRNSTQRVRAYRMRRKNAGGRDHSEHDNSSAARRARLMAEARQQAQGNTGKSGINRMKEEFA